MRIASKNLPWLVFLFGAIATCWTAWSVHRQIDLESRRAFEEHAAQFRSAIERRLQSYEDVLFGLAGLYQSNAGSVVTQEEFSAYAESLALKRRAPAIDAVNYAEYVPAADKERFIARFRSETKAASTVPLVLPPDKSEYMVITRVFPRGMSGYGVNLFMNPRRYANTIPMEVSSRLFQRNRPFSSGMPIRPPGKKSTGMALRLGVFGSSPSGQARLTGSVGIGFNVEEFFKETLSPGFLNNITYRVETVGRTEGSPYPSPVPIFSSELTSGVPLEMERHPDAIYTTSFTLPFGGALLHFEMQEARSAIVHMRDRVLPYAIVFMGFAVFWMASILLRKMQIYNVDLKREIAAQTAQLRQEVERSKALELELTQAAEKERRRVGYELHDELGQRLTGISLGAKALAEVLRPDAPELSQHAAMLERDTSEAIASVRGLAHGLMPVPQGPRGLLQALEQFAISVTSRSVKCVFDFDDPVDVEDNEVATNLYRIAQEAVNNAIRHGGASLVTITLDDQGGKIVLTIADNGKGMPPDHADVSGGTTSPQVAGAGLRIMAHRASVINFRLAISSSRDGGTTIKAQQC